MQVCVLVIDGDRHPNGLLSQSPKNEGLEGIEKE